MASLKLEGSEELNMSDITSTPSQRQFQRWEYRSEGVHLGDKFMGKTKVSSTVEIASLAEAMNRLGSEGWELVSVAPVVVVGKVMKSADRREITTAFFKRPLH
jgi:hypothetical protein